MLSLKDSSFNEPERKYYYSEAGLYIAAVDKLNAEFDSEVIEVISLDGRLKKPNREGSPIWYQIDNLTTLHGSHIVNQVSFYASHYIGFYSTNINGKDAEIVILPRFGFQTNIFNYLLSYACNLYIPKGNSDYEINRGNSYWMMALLWRSMLEKAISIGHIPKEYQKESRNIKTFRGRLDFHKHVSVNLTNQSRFYCSYGKLSMNNIINKTIRYTFKILEEKQMSNLIGGIKEYDNRLASFGVNNSAISISDIEKIRYSKLNNCYKQSMQFSKAIISNKLASSKSNNIDKKSFAFFIDVAELWELYLLKLLQRNLHEYEIYSPNQRGGEYLLQNNYREIIPDIIIEKDKKKLMIIDAKYKFYTELGKIEKYGVSRNDLYQMNTYLLHYGSDNEKLIGLFVSPIKQENNIDIHGFSRKTNYQIGVLNLDIYSPFEADGFRDEIKKRENIFLSRVNELLEKII